MTTQIWKRRVAIVYITLLIAVSAAAIYFAVASAGFERKLKMKNLNPHNDDGTGNIEERTGPSKPTTVIVSVY